MSEGIRAVDTDKYVDSVYRPDEVALGIPEKPDEISEEAQKISAIARDVIQSLPSAPVDASTATSTPGIESTQAKQVLREAANYLETDVKSRIQNANTEELLQMAGEEPNLTDAIHAGAHKAGFPNLTAAILELGAKKEAFLSAQMSGHKQKIDAHKETMRTVLDLKTRLQKLSEEEQTIVLPDDLKQAIVALREKGTDFLPGSNLEKLTSLELRELKSKCDAKKDELQTEIQTTLTTEVNIIIQFLNMLANTMKTSVDMFREACRKANSPHG